MKKTIRRLLVASFAILLGGATAAWACPVQGRLVCTGTDLGIPDVSIAFTSDVAGVPWDTVVTGADGTFQASIWTEYAYVATAALGSDGVVLSSSVVCSAWPTVIPAWEVSAPFCGTPPPPPPPTGEADCSPGYYKNHPEAWCTLCGYDRAGCNFMIGELSARGADGAARRDFAKAQIDACFGTAEKSPCSDD